MQFLKNPTCKQAYTTAMDFDEVLVPKAESTLPRLVFGEERLVPVGAAKEKLCSFVFQHVYHLVRILWH